MDSAVAQSFNWIIALKLLTSMESCPAPPHTLKHTAYKILLLSCFPVFSLLVPTLQFPHIKVPENTSSEKKEEEMQALITHSASFSSLGGSIW